MRYVVLFGDETESKLHSVFTVFLSKITNTNCDVNTCGSVIYSWHSAHFGDYLAGNDVYISNSLKLLGTSAAHNYLKQRAKNHP